MSITFTHEQATAILEILDQNGLLIKGTDTSTALGFLAAHIKAAPKSRGTQRQVTTPPSEELLRINCLPIQLGICQARKWGPTGGPGWGGQCTSKTTTGSDFCAKHTSKKLSKDASGGPDGSCLVCSKAQGKIVTHQFAWEHLGRYVPGQVTLGPKWKATTQTPEAIYKLGAESESEPEAEAEEPSQDLSEMKAYFDTQTVKDLHGAQLESGSEELIAAVSAADLSDLDFEAYLIERIKAENTVLFGNVKAENVEFGSDSDCQEEEKEKTGQAKATYNAAPGSDWSSCDELEEGEIASQETLPEAGPSTEEVAKAELLEQLNVKLEAQAKLEAEAKAKAELEAKAKLEAEAKAKAELEAKAKLEAEAKAKAEQEAKAKLEADAKAKAEQEAKAKAEKSQAPTIPDGSDSETESDEEEEEEDDQWFQGSFKKSDRNKPIANLKDTNEWYYISIANGFAQGEFYGTSDTLGKVTKSK